LDGFENKLTLNNYLNIKNIKNKFLNGYKICAKNKIQTLKKKKKQKPISLSDSE
jgi:hypothetical protein